MNPNDLRQLLEQVRTGQVSIDDALQRVGPPAVADLGFAHVDLHRHARSAPASESPASIVGSAAATCTPGPTALSWSPAWTAPCPVSSADWSTARSLPCRPASATALPSADSRPC